MGRRILQVVPYLHPAAGGPVSVVLNYADRLPALGFESPILTTSWLSPGGSSEVRERYGAGRELTVAEFDNSFLRASRSRSRALVDAWVGRSDIVHVHGLWHALGWLAMRSARRAGVPFVVHPHGMLDPYSLGVRAWRKRLYWRLIEGANLRAARRWIFTTEEEHVLAESMVGPAPMAEVIALGAEDPPEGCIRGVLRREALALYPRLRDRRVLLYFGRVHEKKGLHRLVAAFAELRRRLPDALLLVVGGSEERYLQRIRSDIATLGLEDDVQFTGLLEGRAKWAAIAAADVFALPSMQENFALAVAEVMKLGVPVVISDRVNLASRVMQAGAGRVLPPEDAGQWSSTLFELLVDRGELSRLGASAEALARDSFTWTASTNALANVYRAVLGDERVGARNLNHGSLRGAA